MSSLQFQYEIPVDEFVAGQSLYNKLKSRNRRFGQAALRILAGVALLVIGIYSRPGVWMALDASAAPFAALATLGIASIYGGFRLLFPSRYFRGAYGPSGLAGKSYHADVNETGLRVAGEFCEWTVKWPGVQLKGEDERVLIFYAANTIFIFGKRFLTNEQQQELRRLGGLG
ncbi:MAG TPA: YcxB family protein [Candidatus Aquilonibacter sp.]|nr:YcxB family protein [Candidatus Aquilonibacter sp.]